MPTHPDSNIFPHATGPAIDVVNAHKESQDLVLYGSWFCPFVQRVWIALELKNIPYQWIETNPYHKPDSLMRLNPRGLVPTLSYHNKPIYESTVILQLLEDAYPEKYPLLPTDPYEKAYSRLWMDFVGSRIIPAFHRYLQHDGDDQEGVEKMRQEYLSKLKEFEDAMKDGGDGPFFLGGKSPSLVDVAAAPWAQRHWVLSEMKGPFEVPEKWARWKRWEEAVLAIEEVKKTESEKEPTRGIYRKYADNTAQSEAAKAIREGRSIP